MNMRAHQNLKSVIVHYVNDGFTQVQNQIKYNFSFYGSVCLEFRASVRRLSKKKEIEIQRKKNLTETAALNMRFLQPLWHVVVSHTRIHQYPCIFETQIMETIFLVFFGVLVTPKRSQLDYCYRFIITKSSQEKKYCIR